MRKHGVIFRRRIVRFAAASVLTGWFAGLLAVDAAAQALQWDTDLGMTGAQGGTGDWDGGNFWWNGSANQPWVTESDAIFGGIAGTVDGSGISVNDITFNTASYTLAPSGADAGITFVGDLDFPGVTTALDATINHALHGTVGFSKQGSGRVRIGTADHTLTGSITVNAGELEIGDGFDDVGLRLNVAGKLTTIDPDLTVGALTDNGTTSGELALGGNFTVGGANQNNTYGGDITGTGTLRKVGTGTLTLSGTNSLLGVTFIDAGRLEARNGAGLQNQAVTIAAGATLAVRDSEIIGALIGGGNVELFDATLTTSSAGSSSTLSGIISGQGNLVKTGGNLAVGTLTLTGLNTFNSTVPGGDDITITAGGISVPDVANQGLPSGLGAGERLGFSNGGNARLIFTGPGVDSTDWHFALGTTRGTLEVSSPSGQLTLSGLIDGGAAFDKIGLGTLLLTGSANSFTGDFNVVNGSVSIPDIANTAINSPIGAGNLISLGGTSSSGRLIFTGNGTDSSNRPMTLAAGSAINVSAATGSLTLSGEISGSGDLTKGGPGALFPTNTANSFSGNVTVAEGRLITLALTNSAVASSLGAGTRITLGTQTTAGELVINGAANSTTDRQIDVAGGGGTINSNAASGTTVTLNGAITGTGLLTFAGNTNDLYVLTGGSTRTGATVIDRARVQITGGPGLPNAGRVELRDDTGAQLQVTAAETIGSLQGGAGPTLGRVTLDAAITLGGDDTSSTYSGLVEGAGALTKLGTGTLTLLNPTSTFTGGVTVAGGGAIAIPTGARTSTNGALGANGTITLGDATSTGGLRFTGTFNESVNRPIVLAAGGAIIENASTSGQFSLQGPISGPGGLFITGSRQVDLTVSAKTYTGPTTVQQGTLFLNASIAASAVNIAAGGMFDGGANATTGPLSLAGGKIGGIISNDRTLATGDLVLASGELDLDLTGTGIDALNVTGTVSFNGPIQLVLDLFANPVDNVDVYRIIQNDSGDLTTFGGAGAGLVFAGNFLDEGERFSVTDGAITQLFEIRYGLDAADNDVRLLAVPEPAACALVLFGLSLLRRRRALHPRSGSFQSFFRWKR